ncbi:MAG TPA: hypothetical protein VN668_09745 [Stellaceae bacterium]|nr:hypothetical protein [Stellaceae bacterium]
MRLRTWLALGLAAVLWPGLSKAAELTPDDAATHVGETATVCGTVASAHYAERTRGQPTFLNLDKPYPHEVFTAVIWGNDRAGFGTPETTLLGKHVCASGKIELYRGRAEVILHSANQLKSQ